MSKSYTGTETAGNKHVLSLDVGSAESSPPSSYTGHFHSRAVASETSSDDSEESYREKCENLQSLVRQLNRQLQSEKIRKEGLNTISRSLTEERSQNEILRTENKSYKNAVRILQNRLANAGLQTNVDLEDESPGSSIVGFEALDSLVRENLSLKNELKFSSIDPSKMDETLKQNNHLKETITTLQQQLENSTEQLHQLKKLLASSPDDKLLEISKLHGQLEELRQRGQTKDVLCQSLSDQSHALQERLRETSSMCQQLLWKLEQHEGGSSGAGGATGGLEQQSPLSSSFVKLSLNNPDGQKLQQEYTALQDKMSGLRAQLKEVVKVNEKWQEFHEKRENEFKELKAKLETTEQQLCQYTPAAQLSEQQQEQIDRLVLQYKRQIEVVESDKEKLGDENRQLRVQLSQQMTTNQQLERQITSLLEQLRSRQQSQGGSRSDDKERVMALEMQVKVFSEDFNIEKRDRERAQAKVTELEREIMAYKSQLDALQRSAMSRIQHRRHTPMYHGGQIQCDDDVNLDDVPMPETSGPPMQLIGRGIYQSDAMEDEGEDTVDFSPGQKLPSNDDEQTYPMGKRPTSDILQCPQCNKEFPTDRHCQLLEHMEKCLQ